MEKQDIKSMTLDRLIQEVGDLGLPKFRAGQIYGWLHQKGVESFQEMTNLPAALREQLEERYYINRLSIKKKLVSRLDGTVKYLYELRDGNCVEAVLMSGKASVTRLL